MIQEWDQGWKFVPDDRFVCTKCFDDYAIKAFIQDNAEERKCSYCNRRSTKPIAAPMNSVLELIGESLYSEWNHPDDEGIPYESAEGGYQFDVMDTWDLFDHIGDPTANEEVRKEIIQALIDQMWVQKHFYSLTEDKVLRYSWRDFVKAVKYKTRYLFTLKKPKKSAIPSDTIPPARMLDRIGKVINEVGLVREMKAGTPWFRARVHKLDETFTSAANLGTAPQSKAWFSNRMNPAGIPMFYGASHSCPNYG